MVVLPCMNTPELSKRQEKKESFAPLPLEALMKLKEEIFSEIQSEDETRQMMYIGLVARYSLDDALELTSKIRGDIKRTFFLSVVMSDMLRKKYSDILKSIFKSEIESMGSARDYYDPDNEFDNALTNLSGDLKEKIDHYYEHFIARRKLRTHQLKYTDSPAQYNLESLLEEMFRTDLRDLKGVKSSLAAAMNGALHVRKSDGEEVFLAHGEESADQSRKYQIDKIISLLPQWYKLSGWDKTPYEITPIDGVASDSTGSINSNQKTEYPLLSNYESVITVNGNLFIVKDKSGLYWTINNKWEALLSCEKFTIKSLGEDSNLVCVQHSQHDKTRYICDWSDTKYIFGRGAIFDISSLKWSSNPNLVCVKNVDGDAGILDIASHTEICPMKYQHFRCWENWLIEVHDHDDRIGVISSKWEVILPVTFDTISPIANWGIIAIVDDEGDSRLYTDGGDVVATYPWIYRLWKQFLSFENWVWKFGIMTPTGLVLLFPEYDEIEELWGTQTSVKVRKGGKRGILRLSDCTLVIDCIFDDIQRLARNVIATETWGIWSIDGKPLKDLNGRTPYHLTDTLCKVVDERGINCGVVDFEWKARRPFSYDNIKVVNNKLSICRTSILWMCSLIDENGNQLKTPEPKYQAIEPLWEVGFAVKYDGRWGCIDVTWKELIPCYCSSVGCFVNENGETIVIWITSEKIIHVNPNTPRATDEWLKIELDVLNVISWYSEHPDAVIIQYFYSLGPNTDYRKRKNNLGYTADNVVGNVDPTIHKYVQRDIEKNPWDYVDTITARPPSKGIENTIRELLFPRNISQRSSGYGRWSGRDMSYHAEYNGRWWDALDTASEITADLNFKNPVPYFLTTFIADTYTNGARKAAKNGYTSYQLWEVASNIGYIWIDKNDAHTISLPLQTNNCEVQQVSIEDAQGRWTTLHHTIQPAWVITVDLPVDTKQVKVEFSNSCLEETIPGNISQDQYTKRAKLYLFDKENPFDYSYHLPQECEMFLDEIKKLSPKEKIIACESFVRKYMRCDKENINSRDKAGKPLEQQATMCMQHKSIVLQKHPESRDQLASKLFVGVCEDASNLLYILLLKAWILWGKLMGYAGRNDDRVGHARNYVLIPDSAGNPLLYEIDGTPDNCARQSESIQQKEVATNKKIEELLLQGKPLLRIEKNIESSETTKQNQQRIITTLEATISGLIDMYHHGSKDDLVIAAIEQKIQELPASHQQQRWEKREVAKVA